MPQLFMVLAGAVPPGRHTEQHDIFFGIAPTIKELLPQVEAFWPEANGKLHLDAWREVTVVDGYSISVVEEAGMQSSMQLFFINLGGYKQGEFEEFHYKMLVVAPEKGEAIRKAKETAFYQHTGFKGATSHVDDKWGVDVDDIFEIRDILPADAKSRYSLVIQPLREVQQEDTVHLGYFKLDAVDRWGGG